MAFVALIAWELRRREPLIEIRFFRSAPFSGASAIAVSVFAAMGGFLFLNTLYLQNVRGLSPLDAGLYTLPMAAVMIFVGPLSGRLVGTRGSRPSLVGGGIGVAVSGAMLAQITPTTPYWLLIIAYVLFGIGLGLVNPPITNTAVSGMPPSQAGVAAAVASTSRQVGVTLGVAVLGALAAGSLSTAIGPSFAAATHVSWWIIMGLGVLVVVLGLVTTSAWAQKTAERTAGLFEEDDARQGEAASEPGAVIEEPAHLAAH
jgi:MFS family permease